MVILRHDKDFTQAVVVNKPFTQRERRQIKARTHKRRAELDRMRAERLRQKQAGDDEALQLHAESQYLESLVDLLQLPNVEMRKGGDVDMTALHVLHPFSNVSDATLVLKGEEGSSDLFLSSRGGVGELCMCAREAANVRTKVLVFLGYAGWRPGQLEMEISLRCSWGITAATMNDIIYLEEATEYWRRMYRLYMYMFFFYSKRERGFRRALGKVYRWEAPFCR